MGLFDSIRAVFGSNAATEATKEADADDLFGMSTAYVTMEADLGFQSVDQAALCFSGVDSTDFADTVDEVQAILRAGEEETGTIFDVHEDSHGWEWVILQDTDPEDLVTTIHFAADQFIQRGYVHGYCRLCLDSHATVTAHTGSTLSNVVAIIRLHRVQIMSGTNS